MSELLEIGRPIARGASRCHVLAVRDGVGTMVAACGIACGNFCSTESFESGMTECSGHEEPLCEECRDVVERFLDGGEWEGVESDPHHGVPRSVCQTHGCPELVFDGECWCWEHLTACHVGVHCPHPAHTCEAPVHFCDRHQEPGGTA